MKTDQILFYAFVVNEYAYKRLHFTVHRKRHMAEKATYRPYKGNAQSDLSPIILYGREALEKWAEECCYEIDWTNKILIYKNV